MKELVFLLVFICLSTAFALAALIASFVCAPHAASDEKEETYECGMPLFSNAKISFNFKYINYAIIFLIFDIETIFLFPFALNFYTLGTFAIVEAFIFITLFIVALIYAIKTGLVGSNG